MKIILNILFIAFIANYSIGASLSIEGIFQGKNVYIKNSVSEDGFGFCVTKVTVNGFIMPLAKGDFEVKFSNFNISIGDAVFVVIEHEDECSPRIENPEVLLPKSTYILAGINVLKTGKLTWQTTNEHGKLPFIIEQYRWSKWVEVGQVQGIGTPAENSYYFNVIPHSGVNTLRIVQIDNSGEKRSSKEVKFLSEVPKVTKNPVKVKDVIKFSANKQSVETRYEIYDAYGNIVKKGFGSSVNCFNLLNGAYYINFDNVNEKFIKT
jgi:hypothetical protein